jgi:hypothetical protein
MIKRCFTKYTNKEKVSARLIDEAVMSRQARLDEPGTLHYVVLRGFEKRKIIDDDRDREYFGFRMALICH